MPLCRRSVATVSPQCRHSSATNACALGATLAGLPPGALYRVRATYRYTREDSDELSFDVGEVIRVVEYDDPDEQVVSTSLMNISLFFKRRYDIILLLLSFHLGSEEYVFFFHSYLSHVISWFKCRIKTCISCWFRTLNVKLHLIMQLCYKTI